MAFGIYRIACELTGEAYVGSTARTFEIRWTQHRSDLNKGSHHSRRMQRCWNEHGEAAFIFEILEECDREILMEREQYWIDYLKPALNVMLRAGWNSLGVTWSYPHSFTTEHRDKIAAGRRGKKHTDEWKQSMRNKMLARSQDPEWRQAISLAVRGSDKHKAASDARRGVPTGRIYTEEDRRRHSVAVKAGMTPDAIARSLNSRSGIKHTSGAKEKMAQAKRGRVLSPETKAAMSASQQARMADPEERARVEANLAHGRSLTDNRGRKQSPEHVAQRTAAIRLDDACRRGHPRTEENVYIDPKGHRKCLACRDGGTPQRRLYDADGNHIKRESTKQKASATRIARLASGEIQVKRSCECGTCPKCVQRQRMRDWREAKRKKAAEA